MITPPVFSSSPYKFVDITRLAFEPLLSLFLSPRWILVHNKKMTKSGSAVMSSLALQDGHRYRYRRDAVHSVLGLEGPPSPL